MEISVGRPMFQWEFKGLKKLELASTRTSKSPQHTIFAHARVENRDFTLAG